MTSETKFKETEIGMIPEDWGISRLEEIALKVTDGSHFSPKESCNESTIICTVKDMECNKFSLKDAKHISEEDFDSLVKNGCSPEIGDILISKDGANCLDLIFVYNQEEEIVLLSSIAIVKLKKSFNPYFYRYYLLSPQAQKLMRNGYVSGSAIPRVILKDFKKLPVPVPPKSEIQDKIADIMWNLDQKIELNRQINVTLEQIAQTLFKRWFIDFEFPDENGNPYKSSGGRIVDSGLGEIPEGWRVVDLKEMSKIISKGTTPSKKQVADAEGAPSTSFIKVKDIADDGQINRAELELIHESIHKGVLKRSILFENDLLFSIAGTIGRVSIVENDLHNSNINQAIAFIRLNRQEHLSLVLEHLKSKRIQEYAMTSIVQGVQANISLATIGSFQIVVPNDSILTAWNKVALSLHNEKLGRQKQNRLLSQLRDTLLPKLMSGKIRVEC